MFGTKNILNGLTIPDLIDELKEKALAYLPQKIDERNLYPSDEDELLTFLRKMFVEYSITYPQEFDDDAVFIYHMREMFAPGFLGPKFYSYEGYRYRMQVCASQTNAYIKRKFPQES